MCIFGDSLSYWYVGGTEQPSKQTMKGPSLSQGKYCLHEAQSFYVPIGNPIKQYKKMLTWGFLLACTNRGIPNPRIQHVLKFWLKKSLFSTVITVLNFTLVVRLSLHFHRRPPKIMRFGSLVTYYYSWQYQTSVVVSVTDIYNGYQN